MRNIRSVLPGLSLTVASLALAGTSYAAGPGSKTPHSKQAGKSSLSLSHVLLISIDGMHALDFINCSNGISGVNGGAPYCPNLASLKSHAADYLYAQTSQPSDSFPGLTALVSGSSPRSAGAFYDVAYDRSLDPPATTTGNGVAGAPGACVAGTTPTGTTTEFDEGIDLDQTKLNGGAPAGVDGGIQSIDPKKLERDPAQNCAGVYPWNFVRTNTIFGVIHAAGGYTAWSDKHPAYSSVAGPGDGSNVDDFYAPEINSAVVALPGIKTVLGLACDPVPDPSQTGAWTDSFQNIQCYDTLKVDAIRNEIDGFSHNRKQKTKVPEIFGMNFQAVSVGQKLIEKNVGSGGYTHAQGTPTTLMTQEIQFVDAAIGSWIAELKKQGLLDSTLIIITSKHGQSPVDSQRYVGITQSGPVTTSPSILIDSCLPPSESNAGGQIGPTEHDVSLLWLKSSCDAPSQAC